jgi:predicted nuclease with RNAse H fold
VTRPYSNFVGIDLGGSRGKSTAVARLRWNGGDDDSVWVDEVVTRHNGEPWSDDVLLDYLRRLGPTAVVAIDAPLTLPACLSCRVAVCPGYQACEVPATVWLRTVGEQMQSRSLEVAAMSGRLREGAASGSISRAGVAMPVSKQRLAPYTHRPTEVYLHYTRDLVPRDQLSQGTSPVSARATHLCRALAAHGFELNVNLLEVSPRSTVQALFGRRRARGYKRDADPWNTRAQIVEELCSSMRFSPSSRMSKEEVLRNDHCFDALLSGYTAFLWARDGWQVPGDAADFASGGFIWVPPTSR